MGREGRVFAHLLVVLEKKMKEFLLLSFRSLLKNAEVEHSPKSGYQKAEEEEEKERVKGTHCWQVSRREERSLEEGRTPSRNAEAPGCHAPPRASSLRGPSREREPRAFGGGARLRGRGNVAKCQLPRQMTSGIDCSVAWNERDSEGNSQTGSRAQKASIPRGKKSLFNGCERRK